MEALLAAALQARDNARPDYSLFAVGAALEDSEGRIWPGCNVESASYGLTICAERTALFTAIANGVRSFRRILVVAESKGEPTPPCGACRQVLYDFCGPELEVILQDLKGARKVFLLKQLLPEAFHAAMFRDPV
jgi:cytidine deaminase